MFTSWFSETSESGQNNPAWTIVERATNDILISPDWAANMAVCDYIENSKHDPNSKSVLYVCSAIKERLVNGGNATVALHALILLETCIKNCSGRFHFAISKPNFMRVLEDLAVARKGSSTKWGEVKEKALEIIQYLGQKFGGKNRSSFPEFYNTYAKLTARGCIFPITQSTHEIKRKDDLDYPVLDSPPKEIQRKLDAPNSSELRKLRTNLNHLEFKLDESNELCYRDRESDRYLDLMDFLEQCKPRMLALINAGAHGLLSDSLLLRLLQLNDRIYAVLIRLKDPDSTPLIVARKAPDFSMFKIKAPRAPSDYKVKSNVVESFHSEQSKKGNPKEEKVKDMKTPVYLDSPYLSPNLNTRLNDEGSESESESTGLLPKREDSMEETSKLLSS